MNLDSDHRIPFVLCGTVEKFSLIPKNSHFSFVWLISPFPTTFVFTPYSFETPKISFSSPGGKIGIFTLNLDPNFEISKPCQNYTFWKLDFMRNISLFFVDPIRGPEIDVLTLGSILLTPLTKQLTFFCGPRKYVNIYVVGKIKLFRTLFMFWVSWSEVWKAS